MDFSTQIVPAIILLIANVLSGKNVSLRWETVSAIFGLSAIVSLIALIMVTIFVYDSSAKYYLLQIFGFCLLTALSRDYERILYRFFPWNR